MASGGNRATVSGRLKGLGSVPPCPSPHGTDSTLPGFAGRHPARGWQRAGSPGHTPPWAVRGGDAEGTAASRARMSWAFSEPNFCVGRRDDSRGPLPLMMASNRMTSHSQAGAARREASKSGKRPGGVPQLG